MILFRSSKSLLLIRCEDWQRIFWTLDLNISYNLPLGKQMVPCAEDCSWYCPHPYLKDLDALYDQFKEHWTKVYGDSISRVFLLQDIIMFHQFLVGKLLEDYTDEPYTINRWELNQAKCIIEQEDHAGAKNGSTVGTAYPVHVIYPLEEMMLSRDYVMHTLRLQIGTLRNTTRYLLCVANRLLTDRSTTMSLLLKG